MYHMKTISKEGLDIEVRLDDFVKVVVLKKHITIKITALLRYYILLERYNSTGRGARGYMYQMTVILSRADNI